MGKEPLTCNSDHAHNWSLPKAVLCPPCKMNSLYPKGFFLFFLCAHSQALYTWKRTTVHT